MKAIRKANVLAVDDQHANLLALDAVLSGEFNVIRANSGPEAISILDTRSDIDVILMDAQMPIMDGFEAATLIKAMPECSDIPIVFITAVYNEDPFIKQGYKVGAIDYFSKPFDPEILKTKVAIYASFRLQADILRHRERQLRESEELLDVGRRLSAMVKDLRVGVIVTDALGHLCEANEEFLDICGELHSIGGIGEGERRDPWGRARQFMAGHQAPLAKVLEEGGTFRDTLALRCMNGAPRSLVCSGSPLRAPEGHVLGAVLVLHDVTARVEIEKDLERRIGRLMSTGLELQPS